MGAANPTILDGWSANLPQSDEVRFALCKIPSGEDIGMGAYELTST